MRKINKKGILRLAATFLGLLILFAATFSAKSQTAFAAPFTCDSSFYQVINGELRVLDPTTGQYNLIGYTNGISTNAIGYNRLDNYIYGWQTNDGWGGIEGVIRIEDDATVTNLGVPFGVPPASSFYMGDMDDSGNLYVLSTNTLYRIDVTSMTAAAVVLSSTPSNTADLVYVDGMLYASSSSTLYVINPLTGNVVSHSYGTGGGAGTYGAGWAADDSKLFFTNNNTGMIYEVINFATPSPSLAPVLQGSATTFNDGASCSVARSPIPPLFATDDTNSTTVDTAVSGNVLPNDSGRDITVTSYTQPPNGTVAVNPDGSYTYTPNNGFTGTDTFTYTITDEYGETRTATVTITVTSTPVTPVLAETGISVTTLYVAALTMISASVIVIRQKVLS